MLWMILVLIHVSVYFLMANREQEKKDIEKRINNPVIHVAPDRFTMKESGYYDPDKQERERIARRNRDSVEEADRIFKTVGVFRKLNKM
jgi:hypothetical protein